MGKFSPSGKRIGNVAAADGVTSLTSGQVQIRIQIVGARIYQAVIPKVLKIPD